MRSGSFGARRCGGLVLGLLVATAGPGTRTTHHCLRLGELPVYAAQFHIEMAGTPEVSRRIMANFPKLASNIRALRIDGDRSGVPRPSSSPVGRQFGNQPGHFTLEYRERSRTGECPAQALGATGRFHARTTGNGGRACNSPRGRSSRKRIACGDPQHPFLSHGLPSVPFSSGPALWQSPCSCWQESSHDRGRPRCSRPPARPS